MKILIVEDNTDEVHLIRDTLRHLGWRMEDASTIERAFGLIEHFEPDTILLDLDLPDSTPKETLKAIPRLGAKGAMIVLTGHATQDVVAEAFRQGADDCLDKQSILDVNYFVQSIRHGYERFMRRTNLSKKEASTVLRALTDAESGAIAGIPFLRQDVEELKAEVLTGPNALKTNVALLRDQMQRMDWKANLRTVLLIIFLVLNAGINWLNAINHTDLPKVEFPDALQTGK